MELRVLRYFQAVVDEGSITDAAKALHVTQPTLSRQIAQLEDELGTPLFARGRGGVEPTARGAVLYRYANDILALADRAREEAGAPGSDVEGTVHIGAGETRAFAIVAQACARVRERYPRVTFEVHDGTSADLWDNFVHGFYDILLDCDSGPNHDYEQLVLPVRDVWGVVARKDDDIALLDVVRPHDLAGRQLITSPQGMSRKVAAWAGDVAGSYQTVATYGLPLNAKQLVVAGLGVMVTYGSFVNDLADPDDLCFRPLAPKVEAQHKMLWRKTFPTKPAQALIDELRVLCA